MDRGPSEDVVRAPALDGRSERIEDVFLAALEVPLADRAALLDARCAGDPALRREVESLLAAHNSAGDFLKTPARDRLPEVEALQVESLVGTRVGPFEVTGVVGSGGMGTVYKAVQEHPNRTVALKVSATGALSDSALRRFRYEAEILGRLRHAGIAHVYEAGLHREGALALPYIAMEYVLDARDIVSYSRGEGLSLERRLELFLDICDAVDHGHRKGITHRDLKPANVLVDGSGQPKVIDYGIAHLDESEGGPASRATGAGQLLGTLPYMSPEQCGADPTEVDTRTDVYSLGVILYELVTGELPYAVEGASPTAAARIVREVPATRPSVLAAEVPVDLEAVILKTLEKEPAHRYASVAALGGDVRRFLRREPVEARPPGGLHQAVLFAARHRALVGATACVLAVLVAATAVSIGFAVSAARERATAVEAHDATLGVVEFLDRVLSSGRPELDLGRERSLRDVLDEASAEIEAESGQRPFVEAVVRRTVGLSYRSLGDYARAETHLLLALDRVIEATGGSDSATAEILLDLSVVHRLAGDLDRARDEAERCIESYGRLGEARSRPWAVAHRSLGRTQLALGDFDAAEEAYATALEVLEEIDGGESHDVALARKDLGTLYTLRGDYVAAEGELRRALAVAEHVLGAGHPEAVAIRGNLGATLQSRGDSEGAEAEWRVALEAAEGVYADDHPIIADLASNLGISLASRGRRDEAEPLYRRALEIRLARLGERHTKTAVVLGKLGWLLVEKGEVAEARELLTRALEINEELLPGDHLDIAGISDQLGFFHWKVDEFDAAIVHLERALAVKREALPAGNARLADTACLLAVALLGAGRAEEAVPHAEEAWRIRRDRLPATSWLTQNARSVYGEALAAVDRHAEAESHLTESAGAVEAALGGTHPRTVEARARVVALYEAWDRPDDAARWRGE